MPKINRYLLLFLVLLALPGCAKKPSRYQLKASVITTKGYGVIVYDLPVSSNTKYRSDIDPKKTENYIAPTIPGEYDTLVLLPPFKGYEGRKLPDSITISYQYAEINDCSIERQGKPSHLPTDHPYAKLEDSFYTKHNCKNWKALPDRKYKKTINFDKLKKSREYKNFGKRNRSGNTFGLTVMIEFKDSGDVEVRGENTTSNPWK